MGRKRSQWICLSNPVSELQNVTNTFFCRMNTETDDYPPLTTPKMSVLGFSQKNEGLVTFCNSGACVLLPPNHKASVGESYEDDSPDETE